MFPVSALLDKKKHKIKWYQYIFIDEYHRFRYLEIFQEHSTYSSAEFIRHCIQRFLYAIERVQTDNGPEFANRLVSKTSKGSEALFECALNGLGIRHKQIHPYTLEYNGKVERSHIYYMYSKDNKELYTSRRFYSFGDFKRNLLFERSYNNFSLRPLNWHSLKQVLVAFPNV